MRLRGLDVGAVVAAAAMLAVSGVGIELSTTTEEVGWARVIVLFPIWVFPNI